MRDVRKLGIIRGASGLVTYVRFAPVVGVYVDVDVDINRDPRGK